MEDPLFAPLQLLTNLIKAHVIDKFYDPRTDEFLSFDEVPLKTGVMMPDNDEYQPRTNGPKPGTSKDVKRTWWRLVLSATTIEEQDQLKLILNEITWQLSSVPNKTRENPTEQQIKNGVKKRIDDRKPGSDLEFFLSAQLLVTRHANRVGHPFHDVYAAASPSGTPGRLVYKFDQMPDKSKFTFVSSDEARELVTELDRIKAEIKDLSKLSGPDGVWVYPDLSVASDPTSPLKTTGLLDVVTRNLAWFVQHIKSVNQKYAPVLRAITEASLEAPVVAKSPPVVIKQPEVKPKASAKSTPKVQTRNEPVQSEPAEPKIAPRIAQPRKTQPKIATSSGEALVGPNAEERERERIKAEWVPEVVDKMVRKLNEQYCNTEGKKVNVLRRLEVASGKADPTGKKLGTVFNLSTSRLLKKENNDGKVVQGQLSGEPLFKPGTLIQLSIDAKDPSIDWFPEGTTIRKTTRTSGNKELNEWLLTEIMPRVWERFVTTCFPDYTEEAPAPTDEASVEERIKETVGVAGTEAKSSTTAFKKTFKPASELGFALRYAATLPMLPEELQDHVGGDTATVERYRSSVAETVLKLESDDESERLKLIAKNMNDLFKLDPKSSLIAQVRGETIPQPAKVTRSTEPFTVKSQQTGTVEQLNVDFRSKVYPKVAGSEDQEN